jgi:hypothetical protein
VEFELDENECAAIGRVTVHWAYLEHALYAATCLLADQLKVATPEDSKRSSFTRRLRALTDLSKLLPDEADRRKFEQLIGRIANAEQDRHKLTHGVWDWDHVDPERLRAASYRPGYKFEKRYDAATLHQLASRIGELSFSLQFPNGWEQAVEQAWGTGRDDNTAAFGSISRKFLRMLRSKTKTG